MGYAAVAGMLLRVAHVGNMANDGFCAVKALRDAGVDAELIVDARDFGMGLPHWELFDVEADPYQKLNLDELPPLPEWITVAGGKRDQTHSIADVMKRTRRGEYDLLHLHFPFGQYLQFSGTPYLVYEAGFLRSVVEHGDGWSWTRLGKRAYKNSVGVTWTNTDMGSMIAGLAPRDWFIPFAIDTQRYRPAEKPSSDRLSFLHPSRQVWDVKGNDRMLHAYVKWVRGGGDADLTLVDWGFEEDVAEAKHILEPVADHVKWVPPMSKPRLIEAYQRCDAVLDQFTIGASGTTGFEAMACGAPLMIYFAPSAAECFGETPPCINVSSSEEILAGFEALSCFDVRDELAAAGRGFVERHLSYPVAAKRLKEIYEEVD